MSSAGQPRSDPSPELLAIVEVWELAVPYRYFEEVANRLPAGARSLKRPWRTGPFQISLRLTA